jgi:hypothetical protein
MVLDLAQAKVVGGQPMSGPLMAELLVAMVQALNAKEIPNVASIVESFNQQLIQKSLQVGRGWGGGQGRGRAGKRVEESG